jgi:branched-chain amino acid transport system ATP-binding protein
MLETRDLSVYYGAHRALEGASVKIEKNEIVVMLGANGAGKSTFLRAIGGITPAAEGSVVLMDGADITGHSPHDIVESGIALVPEDRGIFADLTVRENLILGAYPERARAHEAENLERVLTLFPKLNERQSQAVHTMSGGERQMVAIGRAMMSHPTILMLDEPSLGLSPLLCTELFRSLKQVRDTGVGIFLVEQNAKQSLAIADRGYLLENGQISGADSAEALSRDQAVINAYLGGGGTAAPKPKRAPAAAADPSKSNGGGGEDNRYAITAAGLAVTKTRIEDILPVSIDDLVANAANIQSDHVASTRAAAPTAPSASPAPSAAPAAQSSRPAPTASDALQDMLASFEKAAADALSGKTRPADSGTGSDGHG